jgi:curved DNA-binding protein CbpA
MLDAPAAEKNSGCTTCMNGSNVTDPKKTLYEALEVSPSASLPEIKAAHRRVSLKLMSGKLGLSREDIDSRLRVIDLALRTLSNPASRDAYDAGLRAPTPRTHAVVPLAADPMKIAAAIRESHQITAAMVSTQISPLRIVAAAATSSVTALKKILMIVLGLLVLGIVVRCSSLVLNNRQSGPGTGTVSKAEEKVILQEYYQTHGVRPASKIEADLLEIERRRQENESRQAALEKEREEEKYRRFVEESRQIGAEVTAERVRDEERIRYEEEQRNRQREEAEREAERIRLEDAWRRLERESRPQ